MKEHTNIKVRSLLEAEARLRELERRLKSGASSKEDAIAYSRAAERAGKTDNYLYYKALWDSGIRPSNDDITMFSIGLSDAYDQVVIDYAQRGNMSTTYAGELLGYMKSFTSGAMLQLFPAYASRLHIAIGNPAKTDLAHIEWIIKFMSGVLEKAPKLNINPFRIRALSRAVDRYKMLAGQK